jgi:hypothetical protein
MHCGSIRAPAADKPLRIGLTGSAAATGVPKSVRQSGNTKFHIGCLIKSTILKATIAR